MSNPTTIVWLRRDLRLTDQPAFHSALERGGAVVPVFILSPDLAEIGAAAKWRLGQSLAALSGDLAAIGSRLILRRGAPDRVLDRLIAETGADAVIWSRLYSCAEMARDSTIKASLTARGLVACSVNSNLLFEPWTIATAAGTMFKVYAPFWRAVARVDVGPCLAQIDRLPAPQIWPASDNLADWAMGAGMDRGGAVVARYCRPGERQALHRLAWFLDGPIARYHTQREQLSLDASSGQSEYLSYGEISARYLWHAGHAALARGEAGAERFLKELVWREFAWHLMFHTPRMISGNWRENWDAFPWRTDHMASDVIAWKQGRTGLPFVDAGMRELYVTGRMHNRVRMIAASFLTKHLICHWKIGMDWFADCLTDWDPASNAMGWQWVAGSGPDAAPYFRVFNPQTQADRFDHGENYVRRWIAEGQINPPETALDYYRAVPLAWNLSPADPYPAPVIGLKEGRARALAAYGNRNFHDFPTT